MRTPKSLLLALSLTTALVSAEPLRVPVGNLNIDSDLVRAGYNPRISWEIAYPKPLDEIIDISDPGEITILSRTEVEIRVVGVAFQSGPQLLPASLQTSVSGGSWQNLFAGTGPSVDPSAILYQQVAEAGTTFNFSARGGTTSGGWSFSANTLSSGPQVTHLQNGDLVPHYVPAYDQDTIENYLSGYVSSESEVTIGPRDLIFLFELGTTNPDSSYFDMQDIAVVVTFKDVEE